MPTTAIRGPLDFKVPSTETGPAELSTTKSKSATSTVTPAGIDTLETLKIATLFPPFGRMTAGGSARFVLMFSLLMTTLAAGEKLGRIPVGWATLGNAGTIVEIVDRSGPYPAEEL